jgi:hypothetical protein
MSRHRRSNLRNLLCERKSRCFKAYSQPSRLPPRLVDRSSSSSLPKILMVKPSPLASSISYVASFRSAIKAPGFGDNRKSILGNLAILTGGTLFTDELDIKLERHEIDRGAQYYDKTRKKGDAGQLL